MLQDKAQEDCTSQRTGHCEMSSRYNMAAATMNTAAETACPRLSHKVRSLAKEGDREVWGEGIEGDKERMEYGHNTLYTSQNCQKSHKKELHVSPRSELKSQTPEGAVKPWQQVLTSRRCAGDFLSLVSWTLLSAAVISIVR